MRLPRPRGPLSTAVLDALAGRSALDAAELERAVASLPATVDLLSDDDFHIALWSLYELAFRGFEDVADEAEWDPELLRVRRALERLFEQELRFRTSGYVQESLAADGDVADRLFALTASMAGSGLDRYLHREATEEQFLEFMRHRSIYHLKESDPSAMALARLDGRAKVALAELLYDEYGGGAPERLHTRLFADALAGCGLDPSYGAYIDEAPGHTLAVNNAMSLFALHRSLVAASMGHLGAFEATSSLPCRRVSQGIRRLGLPDSVAAYYDEHIEADAVHEQVALRDICASIAEEHPDRLADVFFGAAVCLYLDAVSGAALLDGWRRELPAPAGDPVVAPLPEDRAALRVAG